MENGFKDWYINGGCSLLNKTLLELKGKGIGRIPLANLLPAEFCGQTNQAEILSIIQHDGVDIDEDQYSDGSVDLFIFIR